MIQCASSCPVSTAQHPTINNNYVPGEMIFDAAISWDFVALDRKGQLQVSIRNLLNKDPPLRANTTISASTIPFVSSGPYFDWLGRIYKISLQLDF